jgi:hypothetical protein
MEHDHLAQANRHIADAERRVAGQEALIERLLEQGQDVTLAETLLRTFEDSLAAQRSHRVLILKAIAAGRE